MEIVARSGSAADSTSNLRASTARRIRSAIWSAVVAGVSGRRTQNSSPPKRAATSYGRSPARKISAMPMSTASPAR